MCAFFQQTTETYIRLENQTFFTNVVVTVTPHTLWVQSSDDLAVTSTFSSLPMSKFCQMHIHNRHSNCVAFEFYSPVLDI